MRAKSYGLCGDPAVRLTVEPSGVFSTSVQSLFEIHISIWYKEGTTRTELLGTVIFLTNSIHLTLSLCFHKVPQLLALSTGDSRSNSGKVQVWEVF